MKVICIKIPNPDKCRLYIGNNFTIVSGTTATLEFSFRTLKFYECSRHKKIPEMIVVKITENMGFSMWEGYFNTCFRKIDA